MNATDFVNALKGIVTDHENILDESKTLRDENLSLREDNSKMRESMASHRAREADLRDTNYHLREDNGSLREERVFLEECNENLQSLLGDADQQARELKAAIAEKAESIRQKNFLIEKLKKRERVFKSFAKARDTERAVDMSAVEPYRIGDVVIVRINGVKHHVAVQKINRQTLTVKRKTGREFTVKPDLILRTYYANDPLELSSESSDSDSDSNGDDDAVVPPTASERSESNGESFSPDVSEHIEDDEQLRPKRYRDDVDLEEDDIFSSEASVDKRLKSTGSDAYEPEFGTSPA